MADPNTPATGVGEGLPVPAPRPEGAPVKPAVLADIHKDVQAAAATAGTPEVVPEYPVITRHVASFSDDSADALKVELGLAGNDLLVGIPTSKADSLGLVHGEVVKISTDGKTITLGERKIRVVTKTPKGKLTNVGLSKGIRTRIGLKDHRETGTGTADRVPFTMTKIGDEKVIWLKVAEKNTTDLTP